MECMAESGACSVTRVERGLENIKVATNRIKQHLAQAAAASSGQGRVVGADWFRGVPRSVGAVGGVSLPSGIVTAALEDITR